MRNIPHSRPMIRQEDRQAVEAILTGGMIAAGSGVREFEASVGQFSGMNGVATSSGTSALVLALKTFGIGAGDEVVLPSYVCRDVLQAVTSLGADPILCDIDENWRMSPELVAPLVGPRTAAVIVVFVFGFVVPIAPFSLGVPVIVDACQAFGAPVAGADAVVYSFHATKCLTTGEGGMALFQDSGRAAHARDLRDDSSARLPSPMSDLQAALGLSQLRAYSQFLARRREIASRYAEEFCRSRVVLPLFEQDDIPFRYPVRAGSDFDETRALFGRSGIHVRRGVDDLLHRGLSLDDAAFPNSTRLYAETVSLPLYPALSDAEAAEVISVARQVFGDAV